jgi:pimeloyl-ACP methyl ester carboxylesterase
MTTERVVLIHSAIADSRMWNRQAERLRERGYDVIAPDLPGFGNEPLPSGPLSFVEGIARLLPAILVGASFGGRIALETALAHPEGVPKLVLVDASIRDHDWSPELLDYWHREDELLEGADLDGATELTLETFLVPAVREVVRPMQRNAYELQVGADDEATWPEPRPLHELRSPTLVLVGEHDLRDFREIAERIAAEVPHARLEIVPGARHLPSLESPEDFDRLLLAFLGG